VQRDLTRWTPTFLDWSATNIEKETDRSANAADAGESIHQTLQTQLTTRTTTARRRWVIENDGSGEIADLIVLELRGTNEVSIELWHAKPASGTNPSVRVTDMQIVIAQAITSRRWLTDRGLWKEMADRYTGRSSPALKLVDGSDSERLLRALVGLIPHHPGWSLTNRPAQLRGTVVIVQPGLSWTQLGPRSNETISAPSKSATSLPYSTTPSARWANRGWSARHRTNLSPRRLCGCKRRGAVGRRGRKSIGQQVNTEAVAVARHGCWHCPFW
jgi:hypothetical protein